MFTLVPMVKLPKRIDPEAAAKKAAAFFKTRFEARWSGR